MRAPFCTSAIMMCWRRYSTFLTQVGIIDIYYRYQWLESTWKARDGRFVCAYGSIPENYRILFLNHLFLLICFSPIYVWSLNAYKQTKANVRLFHIDCRLMGVSVHFEIDVWHKHVHKFYIEFFCGTTGQQRPCTSGISDVAYISGLFGYNRIMLLRLIELQTIARARKTNIKVRITCDQAAVTLPSW